MALSSADVASSSTCTTQVGQSYQRASSHHPCTNACTHRRAQNRNVGEYWVPSESSCAWGLGWCKAEADQKFRIEERREEKDWRGEKDWYDQLRRLLEEDPGQGQALPLPAAQVPAALVDQSVQALRPGVILRPEARAIQRP